MQLIFVSFSFLYFASPYKILYTAANTKNFFILFHNFSYIFLCRSFVTSVFLFSQKKLQFTNASSQNDLVLVTTILDELFLFVVRFFFFSVCFNNSDVIPLCHVLSVFRNYMAKINVRQLHRGKYKIENVVTRVARCFVLRWEFPAKPLHRKQVGNLSQCQ